MRMLSSVVYPLIFPSPPNIFQNMLRQKKAYLYATLSVLFWSTVASAFKISLRHLNSLQLQFYAVLTSLLVLFFILLFSGRINSLIKNSRKQLLYSILLGFLNPYLYYMVLFKAYSMLTAQEALVLNYLWPITLVILSIPFLKQKISIKSFIAILISFSGVVVIATRGNFKELKFTNSLGVTFALLSTVIWATFWLLNVKDKREELVKLFLNFSSGFIFISITAILSGSLAIENKLVLLGPIYVGIFEMGLTFFVWLKALTLATNTARISNLIYVTPFLSLIIIHFIVGEPIFLSTLVGLLLIITGIILQHYFTKTPFNKKLKGG